MRVYFVRHGESEENVTDVYLGPETPLTETGYEQARFVAERFEKIPVDLIISSTMTRAKETARIIAEKVGQGIVYSDLLVESSMPSNLLHKRFDDPEALHLRFEWLKIRFSNEHENTQYADEESVGMLKERAKKALNFIKSQDTDNILVVTHGTFLRVMLGTILEGDDFSPQLFKRLRSVLSLSNVGITICEHAVPSFRNDQVEVLLKGRPKEPSPIWRILTVNDHAHLG